MDIKSFVNKHGITLTSEYTDQNPHMSEKMNHYKVTLKRVTADGKRRAMTLFFSQGYGIKHEPTADGVLYCLQADQSCTNDSFEDFCSNCGYDNDSRKAERTYNAIIKQSAKLEKFLGADLLEKFLKCEE